jgi:serine/threonine protein kinase
VKSSPGPSSETAPQVPDFTLLRPIGEGGFGQVWLAINRTTGQPRAVKVISRSRIGSRDPAGREIASLVRLESNLRCRHPNLLTIHHVGETTDHLFYVMDLADDLSCETDLTSPNYRPATLENRLEAGAMSADECERLAQQLLAALACLHKADMVHRDVKPANCLFLGGELKLGDFGLLTAASSVTSRLGTLRYMPPDGCMDARADVFAAGLVIYEMLTGLPPERFPSLGDRGQTIAKDRRLVRLNRLTLRACDRDPSRRFRDAEMMLVELATAKKLPVRSPGPRWLTLATVIVAAIVLAFFSMRQVAPVGVNFVTDPYEATILVDGRVLRAPDGSAYRTPCTIRGLSAGAHRVAFQWDAEDGPLGASAFHGKADAGIIDFAENRQIIVRAKGE